ncbi:MAG: hypothetical protein LBP86_02370 [Azoarcus sp.]|jgi:hypothetical protein|nr:hypothetical protein [Azoarcus sp.]
MKTLPLHTPILGGMPTTAMENLTDARKAYSEKDRPESPEHSSPPPLAPPPHKR